VIVLQGQAGLVIGTAVLQVFHWAFPLSVVCFVSFFNSQYRHLCRSEALRRGTHFSQSSDALPHSLSILTVSSAQRCCMRVHRNGRQMRGQPPMTVRHQLPVI
jgi:hypothetical protein